MRAAAAALGFPHLSAMSPKRRTQRSVGLLLACTWLAPAGGEGPGPDPAAETRMEEVVRVTKMVKPHFPRRALVEGARDGEAQVVFEIDPLGQLGDLMVVAYTRPEFAEAAVAAVRQWRFRPYRVDGKAVTTIMRVAFRYTSADVVAVDTLSVPGPLPGPRVGGGKFIHQPCPASELDQPVRPLRADPPLYPERLSDDGLVGRVRVEFYIDGEGQVRFPLVVSNAHPVLASLVIAAVKEWRFEPPRRRGQPALVFAAQEFQFEPGAAPAPET